MTINQKTAVIYARYSSIMQLGSSIDGQVLLCKKLAEREGLQVIEIFEDRAKSGQSEAGRDGWAAMQAGVRKRAFDVVIVEDLNRASRSPSDAPRFKELADFNRVEILTAKGWASRTDFAVHSLINSLDKGTRAGNVRRGQSLRLSLGQVPGCVAYGYRRVLGKPGEHEIDPETSKIVIRIFEEYASGRSPRAIAADLTREGIPTPASHRDIRFKGLTIWNNQAFVGGRYAKGILGNRKYVGEIDWNTHTTEENPDTRKKVKRPTPESEQTKQLNPALRIVGDELWNAAQRVRDDRAVKKFGPGGKVARRPVLARGEQLLSGLLRCGACNGHMRIAQTSRNGNARVACAAAHQHGTCDHRKSYDLGELEAGVLNGMVTHLNSDEAINVALEAYKEEKAFGERNDSERKAVERKLNALNVEISRLVDTAAKLSNPPLEFYKRIDAKEAERALLDERFRQLGGSDEASNLLPFPMAPKFRDVYRQSVLRVHHSLTCAPNAPETRLAFRSLIDSIVVHPTAKRMPYEFTPYARIAALQGLNLFPDRRTMQEVAAEEGRPLVATAPNQISLAWRYSNTESPIISLGRWKAAA
jgi:DNA invertase Pin-like site-specific DNA recombinase